MSIESNYGTDTTIDAPTKKIDEAHEFLGVEFEKISGYVRKKLNLHELANYHSFEIDYPELLEFINDLDNDDDIAEKDDWHDKANAIIERYNKKFEQWL